MAILPAEAAVCVDGGIRPIDRNKPIDQELPCRNCKHHGRIWDDGRVECNVGNTKKIIYAPLDCQWREV